MPNFWDSMGFGRNQTHHNLQDGLFQIASQTCSILVKVNNTNNILFDLPGTSRNSTRYDFDHKPEDTNIIIPAKKSYYSPFAGYRKRLSTVLENSSFGNDSAVDDDFDHWDQNFMLRQVHGPGVKKWGSDNWCRPSCIPISIILILIILVVLVPLLEHTNTVAHILLQQNYREKCYDECSLRLVESIPEGLTYPAGAPQHESTHDAWLNLIKEANESIEIASLYWTLRKDEQYPHNSSIQGEEVFQALYDAGLKRNIKVKIVQSAPTKSSPNIDTEFLRKKNAAEVRSVNFPRLLGENGVLHTKLWIIDRKHFYIGSANMDWRSLTQVKELGVVAYDCSCLIEDIGKIFEVYWSLGLNTSKIPETWPTTLETLFNFDNPMNINLNGYNYTTFVSSSPPPLSPHGRTEDVNAIVQVMHSAEKFIYISVMDYYPLMIYTPKKRFWPMIDNAIRAVALDNHINVKMLISWWNHSHPSEDYFLRSLTALSNSFKNVNIEVKRFVVPATADQLKIPFARVNHNKYMVTDKAAYIGTSNWSGDYFTDTAGVAIVINDFPAQYSNASVSIRQQLQDIFERDWNSIYARQLLRS